MAHISNHRGACIFVIAATDKSMMVFFNSSNPTPNLADILRIFFSRGNKCSIVFISQAGGRSILFIAAIILPSLFYQ